MKPFLPTFSLGVLVACGSTVGLHGATPATPSQDAILVSEFIEAEPLCAEVHASTLVESAPGVFFAAWFAGTKEADVDTTIWGARRTTAGWSPAHEIIAAIGPDGTRVPSYNPVLFSPEAGRLALVHSAGWEGKPWLPWLQWSDDQGTTWSQPVRLPEGMRGPDRNKPLVLASGEIVHPSTSNGVHIELSDTKLKNWRRLPHVADPEKLTPLQPSVLDHGNGRLQILVRTFARELGSAWSEDSGKTWGPLHSLGIPLSNSGIDATRLPDGRFIVVYNPTGAPSRATAWGERYPITIALSDDGINWRNVLDLETAPLREGYAYPCVIIGTDGNIHLTYTWNRTRIRYMVIDPARLTASPRPTPAFQENFGNLPDGTIVTPANTAFTSIRRTSQQTHIGSLTFRSPSTIGTGSSLRLESSGYGSTPNWVGVGVNNLPDSPVSTLSLTLRAERWEPFTALHILAGSSHQSGEQIYNPDGILTVKGANDTTIAAQSLFALRITSTPQNQGRLESIDAAGVYADIATPATLLAAGKTYAIDIVANSSAAPVALPTAAKPLPPGKAAIYLNGKLTAIVILLGHAPADALRLYAQGYSGTHGELTVEIDDLRYTAGVELTRSSQ